MMERNQVLFSNSGNIISVSRRTDVPAFHMEWFLRAIAEGRVEVAQPYSGKVVEVSLRPKDVYCFVFWSKDYAPLLPHLKAIEGVSRRPYFHFTITGMPKDLELNTPPFKDAAKDFIWMARRFSPGHLVWRFDPICLTSILPFEYYREAFSMIAEALGGFCHRCHISFLHRYRKTEANVHGFSRHRLIEPPVEDRGRYARELAAIGARHGIRLYACCNDDILSDDVLKASCINADNLAGLFGDTAEGAPARPTRKGCACSRSIDIGRYNTCGHGCLYCYGNDHGHILSTGGPSGI